MYNRVFAETATKWAGCRREASDMTLSFAGLLLAIATSTAIPPSIAQQSPKPAEKTGVRARYLGVAGWEITDGKTHILIDPYLSRLPGPPPDGRPGWPGTLTQDDAAVPDTAAIDRYIERADYILLTHGHYINALDAPYIARSRKAVIIGNESVANIARDYGVPDDQIITIRGGEDFDFETFSVRAFPSLHSFGPGKHYFNPGIAPADAKWPLHFRDFVEGGVYGFLIRINRVQIVAFGSMNYIEREVKGLHPDVVLVASSPMRKQIYDYTGRLLRALDFPATVVATHWDDPQLPFDASFANQLKEADEFAAEVRSVSPHSRVIIPSHFEWITFPPEQQR
jgi:L-ascorbate metabolism protein UlaG (beta-lactamase superfamily)